MTTPSRPHSWTPLTEAPLNGGPDPARLVRSFLTPVDDFFVRNHGDVPRGDAAAWRVEVATPGTPPRSLGLAELLALGPFVRVPATIQCAGFRRMELHRFREVPGELLWDGEPVATAEWGGVRLADVLRALGVDPDTARSGGAHLAFEGADTVERDGQRFGYGGSIPLADAIDRGALLVTEMNGAPLTAEHGGPLRVVAPGIIGARSVKWLTRLALQDVPSDNYFQARAYKRLPEPGAPVEAWRAAEPLNALPVNALIATPRAGERVTDGPLSIEGIAWTGHPGGITRVEVSIDGGAAWSEAELLDPPRHGAWQRWRLEWTPPAGAPVTIVARATDAGGATQPPDAAPLWNAKGYLNNAWARVVYGGPVEPPVVLP